jgi:hypothetical protein
MRKHGAKIELFDNIKGMFGKKAGGCRALKDRTLMALNQWL